MSAARVRRCALAHDRRGRARAAAAQRRWRGSARGRRRGSQRADEAAGRRNRYRDDGGAGRGDPPRQGGRHQERADRHRPRHGDAGGRRRSRSRSRRLREDTETFGRKARVAFGRDWIARRKAARLHHQRACRSIADGVVHDYVGGLADIAARRVRFIGDADQRIAEDYLRILRFFRIHAAFGAGEPDRDGYLACIARTRRARDAVGRAGADGDAQAAGRGRRGRLRSRRWPTAACCRRSSAASPMPGRSPR